ncbi:MAG: aminopeptidase [Nanoarchaeota archaeon]|nr:aminopeptidase [Nanoarchaeota archaeon]
MSEKDYLPSEEILDKYADLLINFALGNFKGIKKGDVVFLQVPEIAKPFLVSLRKAILKAGGNPIVNYTPDDIATDFYEYASDEQLKFFPAHYMKGRVEDMDHLVFVIADTNSRELEKINPKKIMMRNKAFKPYMDWRNEKENAGKFTWTLAAYATEGVAKEAGLTLKEYWDEIIKACYLDEENPVEKWKEIISEIERVKDKLNSMKIEKLHIVAPETDLIVGLGENRKWMGGSGRNIPSFEVFISPDWRKTEGKIKFTEPLYRYGNLIKDVFLEFKDGKVVKVTASQGEKVLKAMIETKNADKIGEFSLTDSRISRITKFMAETLFDENVGGNQGNMHLALGKSYQDSYPGNPSEVTKKQWEEMGYNDSVVHTDIVATSPRKVTAYLSNGEEKVIYENGKFVI